MVEDVDLILITEEVQNKHRTWEQEAKLIKFLKSWGKEWNSMYKERISSWVNTVSVFFPFF